MLGELVPWADGQAIIAAKHAIAHRLGDGRGYWVVAFVLNIPVCDAFAGVQLIWHLNRIGGTNIDTGCTGAALVCMGGCWIRGSCKLRYMTPKKR